jgi:hypothetical protein
MLPLHQSWVQPPSSHKQLPSTHTEQLPSDIQQSHSTQWFHQHVSNNCQSNSPHSHYPLLRMIYALLPNRQA